MGWLPRLSSSLWVLYLLALWSHIAGLYGRSIAELIETGEIFLKEPYITNPVSLVVEFLSVFLLFQFGLFMVAQKWVHYFKVLHFFKYKVLVILLLSILWLLSLR